MATTNLRGAANKAMLAVLAVLAVACIAIFMQYWMQPPTKPDANIGQGVVDHFLAHLRDGDAGAAWDATTAEFKSIEGRESFIRTAAKAPVLKQNLSFVSVQDVQVQDEPRAEYIYQSPDSKMVRVLVGYESGEWKVDRLTM
jgi:hypothetical protein